MTPPMLDGGTVGWASVLMGTAALGVAGHPSQGLGDGEVHRLPSDVGLAFPGQPLARAEQERE